MQEFSEKKSYLEKNRFGKELFKDKPDDSTNIIVVIPCYNEPDILKTLESLLACDNTNCDVEVIVLINSGEDETEDLINFNNQTVNEIAEWINEKSTPIKFLVTNVTQLPSKHAGVGLARKIGMDEAASRFENINNTDGIIACLDADCTVEKNYLQSIENHFNQHPFATGCSIYFEHPLDSDFDQNIIDAIISYELFLRYYKLSLHYTGYPSSFHTVGSSMAVRSKIYMKLGGMNRRKAGEDFYFLHKVFPLGNFTELSTTTVFPSPRISTRVPFGTGTSINKIILDKEHLECIYDFQSFRDLKRFFSKVESFFDDKYNIDKEVDEFSIALKTFLHQNNFADKIAEIRMHCSTLPAFVKRLYNWFDGFMVLKFVHFATDNFYPKQKMEVMVKQLGDELFIEEEINWSDKKELLYLFRKIEKNLNQK